MPDKRKRKKVFHINMLKKWFPPVVLCLGATEDIEADEEDFVPTGQDEGSGAPTIGEKLSKEQREQLSGLLSQFKTMMTGKCGRTTDLQTSHPGQRWCFCSSATLSFTTHMHRHAVEREIEMMLAEGIEFCCSE